MPDWNSLVNACYVRPSYRLMERAYSDYRADSGPCKAGVTNQCAVRMSVALERCGFSLNAFEPGRRVHRNRPRCRLSVPHVLGANELARYLQRLLGAPERWRGDAVNRAADELQARTGIIYFDNCFRRRGQASKRGDHIDLWTGKTYYNTIIHVGAGGDATAATPLFGRSEAVWFWPLGA